MKLIALAVTLAALSMPMFASAKEDGDRPTLITVKSDRGGHSDAALMILSGIAAED